MAADAETHAPVVTGTAPEKNRLTLRKFHRWVGVPAALFLISVSVTGVLLQWEQLFGEKEAEKERLAGLTSPVTVDNSLASLSAKLAAAQAAVRNEVGAAPLDRVVWQLKGEHPTFEFFIGGPRAQRLMVNANTAVIERRRSAEEESFLLRLHTGEVFGDGGIVLGLAWGLALLALTISGIVIYWRMRRPGQAATPLGRLFWILVLAPALLPSAPPLTPPHETACRTGR